MEEVDRLYKTLLNKDLSKRTILFINDKNLEFKKVRKRSPMGGQMIELNVKTLMKLELSELNTILWDFD